jgi:hypothetical protein
MSVKTRLEKLEKVRVADWPLKGYIAGFSPNDWEPAETPDPARDRRNGFVVLTREEYERQQAEAAEAEALARLRLTVS